MRLDINFASREYVFLRKVYFVLTVGIAACIVACVAGYMMYLSDVQDSALLRQEIEVNQNKAEKAEAEMNSYASRLTPEAVKNAYDEAAFVNSAINRRVFSWTTFLNRLEGLVPAGAGVTSIKPDFGSMLVSLTGQAQDMQKITEFIGRLSASEYFGEIPPVFNAVEGEPDKATGKTVWTFSLQIQYLPEGAPKPAAPDKEG
jgi:Tfp pilus assembly protein PilN